MRQVYHWSCPRCHALYAALSYTNLMKKIRKHRCRLVRHDEQLTLDGEAMTDYPERFIHLPRPHKPKPEPDALKYRQKSLEQWLSQ